MATPIINSQMDAINSTLDTLEDDLVALRPLLKDIKSIASASYFTESGTAGAVASFDDGAKNVPVRSLSVAITPIQSGTGDPAPDNIRPITGYSEAKVTVAGLNIFDVNNADWKNQYLLNSTGAEEANNGYKYTQAYTKVLPSTTYAVQMNKTSTASSALSVCQYDANKNFVKRTVAIIATSGTGVENGTFTTDASVKYIRFSAPYSSATGDGSYNFMLEEGDTPSTYEAFNGNTYLVDWGTNLLEITDRELDYQGITYVLKSNNTITLSGIRSTSDNGVTSLQSLWTLKAGTYCLSGDLGRADCYLKMADSDGNQLVAGNGSFTLSADKQVRLQVQFIGAVNLSTAITFRPQLQVGSTPTAFRPHANPFVGTVYGGTLDVKTGVLTIDTEGRTILGSDVITASAANGYAIIPLGDFGYVDGSYASISNMFVNWTDSASTIQKYCFKCLNSSGYNRAQLIFKCDFTSSTSSAQKQKYVDFLDEMNEAGTPLVVVYGLATPITVQLTPTEVMTLLGTNNIWADTGDITEVTIRCDTALYIQKLVG